MLGWLVDKTLQTSPASGLFDVDTTMDMSFDLVDLGLFINIAETSSVTHGAERSYMSVPSASTRVKNIEDRLGVQLLYRSSHGVTLTPAGQAFLYHSRIVVQQLHQLRGDLHEYSRGTKGHLRVSATTMSTTEFLPRILNQYLTQHPDVNVNLREQLSHESVRAVCNGTTDIGIVSDSTSTQGLKTKPYRQYRHTLATSLSHPLAERSSVTFEETLDFDHVGLVESSAMQGFLLQAASGVNRILPTRIHVGSFEALCRMVESNIGVSVMPELVARRHAQTMALRMIPLEDGWAVRKLIICARDFQALPGFATSFVDMLLADVE
jgi:DNA-binding transcriptional LysR family regulator